MQDFEKLGVFYLGRLVKPESGNLTDEPLLYDARDLTTHAVCVGMTGSGKTGLCLSLLEEAAIDGVPAIAVDPKGDLGNLLLAFPELEPQQFLPWIDPGEAARKGATPEVYAAQAAAAWRQGLADWGQDGARIARFRAAVDVAIYTPGSTAGLPLSVLPSFAPPPAAVLTDAEAFRDRIAAAVAALLGLAGIEADPVRSREHILLANILDRAWRGGQALDLAALIQAIQKPPFDRIGVFDLETFFPAKDRLALAMSVNNLLATPGFSVWVEGEPLDVQRLLFTPEGKPRLSILSIAHLGDAERMFFVTLLLNEIVAWMRSQSGTSSLRALFYMDEIFGYFPPTAVPPCKIPLLLMMKQARAFGLGVVLATQNPVDLDYKALANAGTWFIGRLQTERDKARVVEGLLGAAGGGPGKAEYEALMSELRNRVFLMRNVHEDAPVVFHSRWALSYLRGPLTSAEIQRLMAERKRRPAALEALAAATAAGASADMGATSATGTTAPGAAPAPAASAAAAASAPSLSPKPVIPAGVVERFLRPESPAGAGLTYRPMTTTTLKTHYVDAKAGIDLWRTQVWLAPFDAAGAPDWPRAALHADLSSRLDAQGIAGAAYAEMPAAALRAQNYGLWAKALVRHAYETQTLALLRCRELKMCSEPGEGEGDFRARLALRLREARDAELERLRQRYAAPLQALRDRIQRAKERVGRERDQYGSQQAQTAISFGATVLGALFGRRAVSAGTIGRATTAARGVGRIARERGDVERAEDVLGTLQQRLQELEHEFEGEKVRLGGALDAATIVLEPIVLRPRRTDTSAAAPMLVWVPGETGRSVEER